MPEDDAFANPTAATRALETILIEKELVSSDAIDTTIELFEKEITAFAGARAVARAWIDDEFNEDLLDDAPSALARLGIGGIKAEHLVVVENTPRIHNVICCTLCSCYPWAVVGLPPAWYKDASYRSRVVLEARAFLQEFGLNLSAEVEIRVWDSNSDIRYMVLPERPTGTEGLGEDELAAPHARCSHRGWQAQIVA